MRLSLPNMLYSICNPYPEHPEDAQSMKNCNKTPVKLEQELQEWVRDASSSEKRHIARDAILYEMNNPLELKANPYKMKTQSLSLHGLGLKTVPPNLSLMLPHLVELDLRNNDLENIPADLGKLKKLSTLWLSHNQIKTLTIEFGDFSTLTKLHIDNNQLTDLPSTLGNLQQLEQLFAYNNKISNLPDTMGQLNRLVQLWFNDNELENLPENQSLPPNLIELGLGYNKLTTIPAHTLKSLPRLKTLQLDNNQVTHLPPELGLLCNLKNLDLSDNPIARLPTTLTNLGDLTFLRLENTPKLKQLDTKLQRFWETKKFQFQNPYAAKRHTIFPKSRTLLQNYGHKTFITSDTSSSSHLSAPDDAKNQTE